MAASDRHDFRVLLTDEEGNFIYMDASLTTAELDLLLAMINQRSNCTAEISPQLVAEAWR